MILQALYDYYERKAKLGEIAPVGWIKKEIGYLIEINENGECMDVSSLVEFDERTKKFSGKFTVVPCIGKQALKHTNSSIDTNFLWDNTGFVLGKYPEGSNEKTIEKKIRSRNSFYELTKKFNEKAKIKEVSTVVNFLEKLQDEATNSDTMNFIVEKLTKNEITRLDERLLKIKEKIKEFIKEKADKKSLTVNKEIEKQLTKELTAKKKTYAGFLNGESSPAVSFRIYGQPKMIFELPEVKTAFGNYFLTEGEDIPRQTCLVTGEYEIIEPKHLVIKGIRGGQSSGGAIVSFNKESFCSYGKIGKKMSGYNAPVGQKAAHGYIQALNNLLDSENKSFIADTTIVFWAEKKTPLEKTFQLLLTKPKDDPDRGTLIVRQLYESVYSGKLSIEDKNRFYVLGLAPNAARISVRYWLTGTVAEFAKHIRQHFDDLEIVREKDAPEFFALSTMLAHTALEYKISNVAPNVAGQVTEAVLKGTPYPKTLLHSTIRRIRAEQHVTRIRAAIIKACINRFNRFYHKEEEEIKVPLDKTNNSSAYLLGRLFAVLEKVQWKALGIETIRERFYGAFSSTPVTVYPQLMKLKNHHLAKMDSGKNFFENLIGEIIDGLDGSGIIPRQFSLEEQGRFAVGYYHQRQDLKYKGKTIENNIDKSEEITHE